MNKLKATNEEILIKGIKETLNSLISNINKGLSSLEKIEVEFASLSNDKKDIISDSVSNEVAELSLLIEKIEEF